MGTALSYISSFSLVGNDIDIEEFIHQEKFRYIKRRPYPEDPSGNSEDYYEPDGSRVTIDSYEAKFFHNFKILQSMRYQVVHNTLVYQRRNHFQPWILGFFGLLSFLSVPKSTYPITHFVLTSIYSIYVFMRAMQYHAAASKMSTLQSQMYNHLLHMQSNYLNYQNDKKDAFGKYKVDTGDLFREVQADAVEIGRFIDECQELRVHTTIRNRNYINSSMVKMFAKPIGESTKILRVLGEVENSNWMAQQIEGGARLAQTQE